MIHSSFCCYVVLTSISTHKGALVNAEHKVILLNTAVQRHVACSVKGTEICVDITQKRYKKV